MLKKRLMAAIAGVLFIISDLGGTAVCAGEQSEQPVQEQSAQEEVPQQEQPVQEEAPQIAMPEETPSDVEEPVLDTGVSSNIIELDQNILSNIFLGTVNLSGLNKEQAMAVVDARMDEITGYGITMQMEDQMVSVPAKELGVSEDNEEMINKALQVGQSGNVINRFKIKEDLEKTPLYMPMEYLVDENMVRSCIEQYCTPYNREAADYSLVRENEEFRVISGQRGFQVNVEESTKAVTDYLSNVWKEGPGNVSLVLDITEPRGSYEELALVKDKLGSGSTEYGGGSSGRATNIENATKFIDGTLLYPGDTFSVCDAIVPFTAENGYAEAASYANGTTVQSYGGGICQVSTTIYLAVMKAELEVVERHNHSMTVGYVQRSMDAAIAEGVKDLVFKNNLEHPIYLAGYAGGGNITVNIYGVEYRPEGRQVTFESETLTTIEPEVVLTGDSTQPYGSIQKTQSSHTGYTAVLWKVVTDENGETTRTQYNKSNYIMSPEKYTVGTKTDNPQGLEAMNIAIGENDLNAVYLAASTYSTAAPAGDVSGGATN